MKGKILIIAATLLGGCSAAVTPDTSVAAGSGPVDAVTGRAYAPSAYAWPAGGDAISALPGAVTTRNARGDRVVIVPSDALFPQPHPYVAWAATPALTALAEHALREGLSIDIIAHDHSDGDSALSVARTEKRAVSVQATLASRGLPLSRTRAIGAGPWRPVARNDSPEGRAANRRIEFVLIRNGRS